jgi:prophage regulatory protein
MTENESQNKYRVLRLSQVKARTGLSRSTIYLAVKNDAFPKPISLGLRSIGWIETEIESWIQSRIKISRS